MTPTDSPEDNGALVAAAQRAMAGGNLRQAEGLWLQIAPTEQGGPPAWLNLAGVRRALGDIDGALSAVDEALRLDPLNFLALLLNASLLERAGRHREAAPAYGDALNQAPPDMSLDEPTRRALAHARAVNAEYGRSLDAYLHGKVDGNRPSGPDTRRVSQFVDHIIGKRRVYHQEPIGYFFPGLPAIEFWDREEFPWLEALEAATFDIQQELVGAMAEDGERQPYINFADSAPLDQWRALNKSRRWTGYHLIDGGRRVEAHAAACPKTMAALAHAPQPDVPGRSPNAMFSVLEGRTHIPPHTGVSNTRLVVHLPLVVPEGCAFRVGNETRTYQPRTGWVFDDTINHEAWNNSDETRVILLFDVWNPRLTLWEREMIANISAAYDEFHGRPRTSSRI